MVAKTMFELNTSEVVRLETARPSPVKSALSDNYSTLAVLRRHKWSIVWMGGVFVLAAALLILVLPVRYTATTQILIQPADLRVVDKAVVDSSPFNDTANSQVESQARVLVSEDVLGRVVDGQKLTADAEFNGSGSGLLSGSLGLLMTAFASPSDPGYASDLRVATLDSLRQKVKVKRLPQTFVVDLSVATDDRNKSAHLANAIANAYLDEQAAAQTTTARRASDSLSKRLDLLAANVRAAEEKVEQFKRQNHIVASTGQLVTEAEATELNNQLVLSRARTAAAKARYEQTRDLLRTGIDAGNLPEAVQSPTVTALREQYAAAARREAMLAGSLGPQHPNLIQARDDLTRAKSLVADEIGRLAKASQSDYERAVADESSLANSLDGLKGKILETGDASVHLRELERDAEAKRNVFEALSVRSRELAEQEGIDTSNVRVISVATAPRNRSFPPPSILTLAAALILGLMAGCGRALLGERMRARTANDGSEGAAAAMA